MTAFSQEAGGMEEVQIVDAIIACDCPFSGKTYLLVVRNILYAPSMRHNLIPTSIMREAGLIVSDRPTIHCDNPEISDHSIFDQDNVLLQ